MRLNVPALAEHLGQKAERAWDGAKRSWFQKDEAKRNLELITQNIRKIPQH